MSNGQAPWEKNGEEFDADRAKQLITRLREENSQLKTEKSSLTDDNEKLKERLANASDKTKSSRSEVETLKAENINLKVQRETGLTDSQLGRLVGDTFEERLEDAEKFASEMGIELQPLMVQDPSGYTEDKQESGGEVQEPEKNVTHNYRAPGQSYAPNDNEDYASIVKEVMLR